MAEGIRTEEREDTWEEVAQYRLWIEDQLNADLKTLRRINNHPDFRSRRLSLAITNLEQAMHWLGMPTSGDD